MPFVTAPNIIEAADFTGGWRPDAEPTNVPPNALIDATNLLIDQASGALVTRRGIKSQASMATGYVVRSMHRYDRLAGTTTGKYLILVATNGATVRVYSLKLSNNTLAQIDGGAAFTDTTGVHWGVTVEGKFYGGGDGLQMYKWDPDGGWDATVGQPSFPTLVDSRSPAGGQVGYDKAFEDGEEVIYGGNAYAVAPRRGFKLKRWHAGDHYRRGAVMVRKSTYDDGKGVTGTSYRRAYKCILTHEADATNRPGDGTAMNAKNTRKKWLRFWKPMALDLPVDDDGKVTEDWDFIPTAATTKIGTWHGERLFLRWDNAVDTHNGKTILQYSAPSKPKAGNELGALTWHPTDFRVGIGKQATLTGEGEGGGWIPVRTGDGDPITGLISYGYYLLVFKRRSTHVLAGTNSNTWVMRELAADIGAVGPRAAVEHEGLVYFVSDRGLYVTDGTQVSIVPGSEAVRKYILANVNWTGETTPVTLFSHDGYLWITLPDTGGTKTIVYEAASKTFWKTDLAISAAITSREANESTLYLAKEGDVKVYQYADPAAPDTDEGSAITWKARFAWFPFGGLREERRIRRIWSLIRGAAAVTSGNIKARRNYSDTVVWTQNITPTNTAAAFFEGAIMPDSYALNLEVNGTGAPAALVTVAAETQPRRVRYHHG